MKAFIFDIKRYAIHDGPGVRTTLFFKGCPLNCWWCHNPESRNSGEEVIDRDYQMDGKLVKRNETIGRWITLHEIISELERDQLFFDQSKGGVTFSGGEPLSQVKFLERLARECRVRDIHTCLDTCGYAPKNTLEVVADVMDLVLFDLKLMDEHDHKKFTGVSNKPILANLEYLLDKNKEVVIRIPVIPGITDSDDNINAMVAYLKRLSPGQEVHLLPYHRTAADKYRRLEIKNYLNDSIGVDPAHLESIRKRFEENGFRINIGG